MRQTEIYERTQNSLVDAQTHWERIDWLLNSIWKIRQILVRNPMKY